MSELLASSEETAAVGEGVRLACDAESPKAPYMLEWLKENDVIYTKFSTRDNGDAIAPFAGRFLFTYFLLFSCSLILSTVSYCIYVFMGVLLDLRCRCCVSF